MSNPSVVTRTGAACGVDLSARFVQRPDSGLNRSCEFSAENAPVTPLAAFALGAVPINVPLPPHGCPLRTYVVVPLPTTVTPAGRADFLLQIPEGMFSVRVHMQFLAATIDAHQNLIWHTSQLITLQL